MIRVGVIGAAGRMGLMVCRAVAESDDLALVAAIDRSKTGEMIGPLIGHPKNDVPISDELDRLLEAEVEVAIDFTHPDVVMENVRWCVNHAIHLIVGTSGVTPEDLQEIERAVADEGAESNVVVAPNFALGAVLMMRFASQAVRYFPAVEVIELHHDQKADAPSGTAIATVRRLEEERKDRWRGAGAGDHRGRPGRRHRRDPRALGPPAGAPRASGGHLREPGPDAVDPPRFDRPELLRSGDPDGGARRDDPARPHGRARAAARSAPPAVSSPVGRRVAGGFARPRDVFEGLPGS